MMPAARVNTTFTIPPLGTSTPWGTVMATVRISASTTATSVPSTVTSPGAQSAVGGTVVLGGKVTIIVSPGSIFSGAIYRMVYSPVIPAVCGATVTSAVPGAAPAGETITVLRLTSRAPISKTAAALRIVFRLVIVNTSIRDSVTVHGVARQQVLPPFVKGDLRRI